MDRQEFYKEGNKVLTQEEYNVIYGAFEDAEQTCDSVSANLREAITGVMNKLWEKRSSTELVTEHFTIINRFGDITVIEGEDGLAEEMSIDDIGIGELMDIVNEII
jgi:hypothetical protein